MTKNQQRMALLGGVVVAALIVVGVVIAMTTSSTAVTGGKFDYSAIPQDRTEDGAFVLGDPDAPITVVEFADFQCGHCQSYTSVIEQVIENYVLTGQARFEFRMTPTVDRTGFNFKLVECAVEQGANFWVAHDVMFGLTSRGWTQNSSQEFASQLNVSLSDLLSCAGDANQWMADASVAGTAGVTGTPAIRVRVGDGVLQPIAPQYTDGGAPYEVIAAAIEAANS
jgi:protein-disulfide isomerase